MRNGVEWRVNVCAGATKWVEGQAMIIRLLPGETLICYRVEKKMKKKPIKVENLRPILLGIYFGWEPIPTKERGMDAANLKKKSQKVKEFKTTKVK